MHLLSNSFTNGNLLTLIFGFWGTFVIPYFHQLPSTNCRLGLHHVVFWAILRTTVATSVMIYPPLKSPFFPMSYLMRLSFSLQHSVTPTTHSYDFLDDGLSPYLIQHFPFQTTPFEQPSPPQEENVGQQYEPAQGNNPLLLVHPSHGLSAHHPTHINPLPQPVPTAQQLFRPAMPTAQQPVSPPISPSSHNS